MAEAKKGYVRDVITTVGRVAFIHLNAPNMGGQYPSKKFEVNFLTPKTDVAGAKILKEAALKAAKELWPNIPSDGIKIGVRDGDEKAHLDGFEGCWYINPKSANKPLIVGPDKKPLPEGEKVNGGDYCRLCLTAGCFKQNLEKETYDALKQAGKAVFAEIDPASKKTNYWRPAVTFYLNMVQKVKTGEAFGGGGANPDLFPEEAPEGLDGKPIVDISDAMFG